MKTQTILFFCMLGLLISSFIYIIYENNFKNKQLTFKEDNGLIKIQEGVLYDLSNDEVILVLNDKTIKLK